MTSFQGSGNFQFVLTVENVTKTYGRHQTVLSDVSFQLNKGEMAFLTGPSGAGKSTLIRLLFLEEQPTSGKIRLGPFDLDRLSRDRIPYLRRHVGVVFQDFRLIPDRTAAENVALSMEVVGKPGREIRKMTDEIMRLVGIWQKRGLYPHQLSGGEAQRAALARAVVNEPLVILADEPTGNLDEENATALFELFRKINVRGSTILIATHQLSPAKRYGSRIFHLENGTLQERK